MIIVVLADAHPTEPEARKAATAEHGHGDLPYMGIWIHPTPEHPLVHIFSNASETEIEKAGWKRVRMPPAVTRPAATALGAPAHATGR